MSNKKEEVKPEEKKEEPKIKELIAVVKELPTQPVRVVASEDGKTAYHLITIEEALTRLMNEIEGEAKN